MNIYKLNPIKYDYVNAHATTEDIAYLFAFGKIVAWLQGVSFEETKSFTIQSQPYDLTLIDLQSDGFTLRGVGSNRSVHGFHHIEYRPNYDIVEEYESSKTTLHPSLFIAIKQLVNNWKAVKKAILDEVAHIAEIMNFEA